MQRIAIFAFVFGVALAAASAFGGALIYPDNAALNLTRSCSHDDVLPVSYVSGPTGVTGAITGARGVVITCFNTACLGQSSTAAASALTYSANTHCNALPNKVPMWVTLEKSPTYIGITAATGESVSTCTVTTCR